MKKYFIIAGEASGDMHGANLVAEMLKLQPDAKFVGFGGDKMKDIDVDIQVHYKDIAFMGFKEVVENIRTIAVTLAKCKEEIMAFKPDAIILVDYPGFNFRIAKWAKAKGFKIIYYILPKAWAWKKQRAKTLGQITDLRLSILPFEPDFFSKYDTKVIYVGNPLTDEIKKFKPDENFMSKHQLNDKPIIAILPGSRKQEIIHNLPIILDTKKDFPDYQYVVAGSPMIPEHLYHQFIKDKEIKLIYDETYNILHLAEAGIIKSGTSALEAALFKVPYFVCYRMSFLTAFLAWIFVRIPFVSLANLIASKGIVKEMIQYRFNRRTASAEMRLLLYDKNYRQEMLKNFDELIDLAGKESPSGKAARIITDWMNKR